MITNWHIFIHIIFPIVPHTIIHIEKQKEPPSQNFGMGVASYIFIILLEGELKRILTGIAFTPSSKQLLSHDCSDPSDLHLQEVPKST